MKINIAILFLLTFAFASCKMSTSPTPSSYIPANANTMIFTVSGATDTLYATADDTTIYGIKGTGIVGVGASGTNKSGFGCGIILANITSTGTYNVGAVTGVSLADVLIYYSYADANGNPVKYSTPETPSPISSNAVGTVTIDTLTATSVVGTFNGILTLQSGNGPTTDTISNGGFRATIL
jgi:hypothetical protein